MKHSAVRYEKERRYPVSLAEAWRLLADTDHLNRTIGLPQLKFSAVDVGRGQLIRKGRAKALGVVPVGWREYPFDWVRERQYAVRREFEWGPIAVLQGGVELAGREDGVSVKVYADFTPANLFGKLLWRLGAGTVDDMVEICEAYLTRREAGSADPTPIPKRRPKVQTAALDRLLAGLARRPVSDRLVAGLRERVLEGSDDQLHRVRPFALADAWGADRAEVLRLLLHAASVGLFELRWQLLCPKCRVPKDESRSLAELPNRFHCETCGIDFAADLDERVELRFSLSPAVRRVEDQVFCIGSPLRTPHVVAQQYLRPRESRLVAVGLSEPVRLRTIGGLQEVVLEPERRSRWGPEISFIYSEGGWTGPHSLRTGEGAYAVPESGALNLRNQTDGPLLVVLEDLTWSDQAATVAEVLALPEFRSLFPGEKLTAGGGEEAAEGFGVAVRELTVVYVQPRRSLFEAEAAAAAREELYARFLSEQLGDGLQLSGESGRLVFEDPAAAVAAALALQANVSQWSLSRSLESPLALQVAVARGPLVIVDRGGRPEYLGRTVSLAARLAREGAAGEVVVQEELHRALRASTDPAGKGRTRRFAVQSGSAKPIRAVGLRRAGEARSASPPRGRP